MSPKILDILNPDLGIGINLNAPWKALLKLHKYRTQVDIKGSLQKKIHEIFKNKKITVFKVMFKGGLWVL